MSYYCPVAHLSVAGNLDEFRIPDTTLGKRICRLRLIWGYVNGKIQPCILHPGVQYPNFSPATFEEVYNDDTRREAIQH